MTTGNCHYCRRIFIYASLLLNLLCHKYNLSFYSLDCAFNHLSILSLYILSMFLFSRHHNKRTKITLTIKPGRRRTPPSQHGQTLLHLHPRRRSQTKLERLHYHSFSHPLHSAGMHRTARSTQRRKGHRNRGQECRGHWKVELGGHARGHVATAPKCHHYNRSFSY